MSERGSELGVGMVCLQKTLLVDKRGRRRRPLCWPLDAVERTPSGQKGLWKKILRRSSWERELAVWSESHPILLFWRNWGRHLVRLSVWLYLEHLSHFAQIFSLLPKPRTIPSYFGQTSSSLIFWIEPPRHTFIGNEVWLLSFFYSFVVKSHSHVFVDVFQPS